MSHSESKLPAVEEVRQANQLFLEFLRSKPQIASEQLGLSPAVREALANASQADIDRAAAFPHALFRLNLPYDVNHVVLDARKFTAAPDRRVLQITLLQCAWTLCRRSVYSARLLLRLPDDAIDRLRRAELKDVLLMSLDDNLLLASFDELDWIWKELLTASRPETRRRLLLIGLQPDLSLGAASF